MKKQVFKKSSVVRTVLLGILFGFWFLCGVSLITVSVWYRRSFYMEFKELLFTLMSPLRGTGQSTVDLVLESCLPWVIFALVIYVAVFLLLTLKRRRFGLLRRIGAFGCVALFLFSVVFSFFALRIPGYLRTRFSSTTIYEEYYVDPSQTPIVAKGKPKNLICLYLESMETTYASVEEGGSHSENYMPNLTELAKENLSFSDSELLGGFHNPSGTIWTMGSLLATTSGVPFSLEVYGSESHNSMDRYETFAPGLVTLGDVLAKKGYRQEFLCGSDSAFGGRDTYFKTHGNYEIFDLYTARERGYIAEDYLVWWGYEDKILFDIAKDEINALAKGDQPFNFTMLTVDAHHVGGYKCNVCQDTYEENLANVINCTDRLVRDFVEWCREQPFYEDTVIVIMGDHPRMDTSLVKDVNFYDRTMYNCILNCDTEIKGEVKNRLFTCFDMFPTTLAALGFEIAGERLGLGTNLFSDLPTLAEELGYEWLNEEVGKFSQYYVDHFT